MMGCVLFLGVLAAAALGAIALGVWLIVWFLRAVGLLGPAQHKAYSRAKNKGGREQERGLASGAERLSPRQSWRKEFGAFRSELDPVSAALLQYAGDAAASGVNEAAMSAALIAKGWAPEEVDKGLADFRAFLSAHPMPAGD